MVANYKIENAKKNKNLIGDEIQVCKVTKKSKTLVDTKKLANKTTKQILLAFIERQEQLWQEQRKFNLEQRQFNKFVMQQFKEHGWIK